MFRLLLTEICLYRYPKGTSNSIFSKMNLFFPSEPTICFHLNEWYHHVLDCPDQMFVAKHPSFISFTNSVCLYVDSASKVLTESGLSPPCPHFSWTIHHFCLEYSSALHLIMLHPVLFSSYLSFTLLPKWFF